MLSSSDIINVVRGFSVQERLMIVEAILRNIREENKNSDNTNALDSKEESDILGFAGIIDEEEATIFQEAIKESRNIDKDEW